MLGSNKKAFAAAVREAEDLLKREGLEALRRKANSHEMPLTTKDAIAAEACSEVIEKAQGNRFWS